MKEDVRCVAGLGGELLDFGPLPSLIATLRGETVAARRAKLREQGPPAMLDRGGACSLQRAFKRWYRSELLGIIAASWPRRRRLSGLVHT